MTAHGLARSISVWARNPAGFAWHEVAPESVRLGPYTWEQVRDWAHQDSRNAGIVGDRLDAALDNIDAVIHDYVGSEGRTP